MHSGKRPIYLDFNASTPIDAEVAECMKPYLFEIFGNPSSSHAFGSQNKLAVENARSQVAELLGCNQDEVCFTSGGSESNNYAIQGVAFSMKSLGRDHIVTSQIEHPAVMNVCSFLAERHGFKITYIPVDSKGIVVLDELEAAISRRTALVTVMHANNETGSIQPIHEIASIIRKKNQKFISESSDWTKILFHTDAAQSIGKLWVNVDDLGVDLLSVAAHKFYGPKGVGALYIRRGTQLTKLIHGADHERNLRAGTENVLEVVGLGKAAEIAHRDLENNIIHMKHMRDSLHMKLKEGLGEERVNLNGSYKHRLCNTLNVSLLGVDANTLLAEIGDEVASSAGAACHSDSVLVSNVLTAMNVPVDLALSTVRISVGKTLRENDILTAADVICSAAKRLMRKGDDGVAADLEVESSGDIRLTSMTAGLGCGCKLRPQALEKLLSNIPMSALNNDNVLVGTNTLDDAGVYRLTDDTALVQTVDFFTPIVDDPYLFGQIAAANSLSDVYAMGGKPIVAMNIVGFPSARIPLGVLQSILLGGQSKADEAQCLLLGGHTVDDNEPKYATPLDVSISELTLDGRYGMSVTGVVHPEKIWRNIGSIETDVLFLTKPLGLGVITTAMKRRQVPDSSITDAAIETMCQLNKYAADILHKLGDQVHAVTDVTGFGLCGHILEMIGKEKQLDASLKSGHIPLLNGSESLAISNIIPGGTMNNYEYTEQHVLYSNDIPRHMRLLLNDAQTNGGLLAAISCSTSAYLKDLYVYFIATNLQKAKPALGSRNLICPFGK